MKEKLIHLLNPPNYLWITLKVTFIKTTFKIQHETVYPLYFVFANKHWCSQRNVNINFNKTVTDSYILHHASLLSTLQRAEVVWDLEETNLTGRKLLVTTYMYTLRYIYDATFKETNPLGTVWNERFLTRK